MTITVNLQHQVRDWIAHNLERGVPPRTLARALMDRKVEPALAVAMVQTVAGSVAQSGAADRAAAEDSDYVPTPLRIAAGTRIGAGDRKVQVLVRMVRPALALLAGLLDRRECDELIALARPRLRRSTVVDPVTGRDTVAGYRSSDGMFFRPGEHPLVAALERRISVLTGLPVENGEGLQLLHYAAGAQTARHFDYLQPTNEANRESIARSGQRTGTFILYLNDVEGGGETTFPAVGLAVTPRRGQALYFEYTNAAGLCDAASLHAGAPVLSGEKWIATKWLRERHFVARTERVSPAVLLQPSPGA